MVVYILYSTVTADFLLTKHLVTTCWLSAVCLIVRKLHEVRQFLKAKLFLWVRQVKNIERAGKSSIQVKSIRSCSIVSLDKMTKQNRIYGRWLLSVAHS